MRTHLGVLMSVAALASGGCGSDPADVAGDYTLSITNGANGCDLENWMEGDTTTAVPLVVTQDGENINGHLMGLAGGYFDVVVGTSRFAGKVDGEDVDMTLFGTRAYTLMGCTWTLNVDIDASIDGDLLQGTITYRAATNNSPDCGELLTCRNVQMFNGTRPPM